MAEETRDFWERELDDINMDGIGPVSKLSPTDRKVIRQHYEALGWLEKHRGFGMFGRKNKNIIKREIIEFSRRLGATEQEIKSDILPSLGL